VTRKQRRLILIGSSLGVLALAAGLVLFALKDSIVFFNSPTDVVDKHVQPGTRIRLGGLVKPGTVQRGDHLAVRFEVIAYADAAGARVGHVLETLRRAGRNHALVVDYDALPAPRPLAPPVMRGMVRGIFSISQVARQLGVALQAGAEVARTFSEIEAALGR